MVQKVLKDMVIIAELWPQASAAIQAVKFLYKIPHSVRLCCRRERVSYGARHTALLTTQHPGQRANAQVPGLGDSLKMCSKRWERGKDEH